jgi:hypothetical protein
MCRLTGDGLVRALELWRLIYLIRVWVAGVDFRNPAGPGHDNHRGAVCDVEFYPGLITAVPARGIPIV